MYRRLDAAAGLIHQAAADVAPSPDREAYDAALLIGDQLDRMRRCCSSRAAGPRWSPWRID